MHVQGSNGVSIIKLSVLRYVALKVAPCANQHVMTHADNNYVTIANNYVTVDIL